MERYSLKDAQAHLEQLIEDAQQGKTVVIQAENDHAVQLVPVPTNTEPKPRKAGSARGQIKMAPDFDEPLADFNEYME
jgi:antitoxin (DNA-binding transcriptional repressor) of toxin-antitoxin stability system